FVPDKLLPGQNNHSIGGARGAFALADCLVDGHAAGAASAHAAGFTQSAGNTPTAGTEPVLGAMREMWVVPSSAPVGHEGKHFIDYQNDVTAADVALAHREGYRSVEHLKRYTTMGMATDQGKTSNVN